MNLSIQLVRLAFKLRKALSFCFRSWGESQNFCSACPAAVVRLACAHRATPFSNSHPACLSAGSQVSISANLAALVTAPPGQGGQARHGYPHQPRELHTALCLRFLSSFKLNPPALAFLWLLFLTFAQPGACIPCLWSSTSDYCVGTNRSTMDFDRPFPAHRLRSSLATWYLRFRWLALCHSFNIQQTKCTMPQKGGLYSVQSSDAPGHFKLCLDARVLAVSLFLSWSDLATWTVKSVGSKRLCSYIRTEPLEIEAGHCITTRVQVDCTLNCPMESV
jgi:hypothetical protein